MWDVHLPQGTPNNACARVGGDWILLSLWESSQRRNCSCSRLDCTLFLYTSDFSKEKVSLLLLLTHSHIYVNLNVFCFSH